MDIILENLNPKAKLIEMRSNNQEIQRGVIEMNLTNWSKTNGR